ncbi:MAG TPA: bacterioferritin [Candidatus Angelobacter sp.]|nr:bacterioferritin [Candidatus Angelobacter sp.]
MKGNEKVTEQLNAALSDEMSASVQYMVQAEMCASWGYHRLSALTKARAIEEMRHAERLIERVIFLDALPNVTVPLTPKIGVNVSQQLEFDLADETGAIKMYNDAAKICSDAGDAGSKDLFESLLHDEERHADFLEAQLHSIKELGIGPYLSQQLLAGK